MEHILYHKFRHRQIIGCTSLLQKAVQIIIAFIFHGIQPILQFPDTCGCPNIPLEKQYKSKKYHYQQNEKGINDIFQFYSFHIMLLIAFFPPTFLINPEPVSRSPHCFNKLVLCINFPHLIPQAVDMDRHSSRIPQRIHSPYPVKQGIL